MTWHHSEQCVKPRSNGLLWLCQLPMLPWPVIFQTQAFQFSTAPFPRNCKRFFNHQASSKLSPYSFRYVRQASCMLASVMGSQKISWPTRDSTFASPDRRAQFTMTFGAAKVGNSKCKAVRLAKVGSEITQLYWHHLISIHFPSLTPNLNILSNGSNSISTSLHDFARAWDFKGSQTFRQGNFHPVRAIAELPPWQRSREQKNLLKFGYLQ